MMSSVSKRINPEIQKFIFLGIEYTKLDNNIWTNNKTGELEFIEDWNLNEKGYIRSFPRDSQYTLTWYQENPTYGPGVQNTYIYLNKKLDEKTWSELVFKFNIVEGGWSIQEKTDNRPKKYILHEGLVMIKNLSKEEFYELFEMLVKIQSNNIPGEFETVTDKNNVVRYF